MTSPDLSPRPASRLWQDVKRVTVRVMLWVSIFAPMIVSAEYLYFRVVVPALDSPRIPAPFVGPDIIVVQPTVAATHVETETIVPDETRQSGKHRAPEPQPTGTRSIVPAEPTGSSRVAPPPVTTTTTVAPSPTSAPPVTPIPPRTSSSRAAPESSAPATSSPTPVYDTLRSETLATSPSLESVIPE